MLNIFYVLSLFFIVHRIYVEMSDCHFKLMVVYSNLSWLTSWLTCDQAVPDKPNYIFTLSAQSVMYYRCHLLPIISFYHSITVSVISIVMPRRGNGGNQTPTAKHLLLPSTLHVRRHFLHWAQCFTRPSSVGYGLQNGKHCCDNNKSYKAKHYHR